MKSPDDRTSLKPLSKRAIGGFVVAFLSIALVGAVSIWNTLHLIENANRVQHTQQVITALESMIEHLRDDAANQRAYIITGDEMLLLRVERARKESREALRVVRELTADNPIQQKQIAALEPLIATRIEGSQAAIDLRRQGDFPAAQAKVRENLARNLLGAIAAKVEEMKAHETGLLAVRTARVRQGTAWTISTVVVGATLGLASLSISLWLIRRGILRRLRAEAEVRQLNETLEQRVVERTAELGATNLELSKEMDERRRLEREILDFSEREQRRLGQELHDDLGQQLNAIGMLAYLIKNGLKEEAHSLQADAAKLMEYIKEAHEAARKLAKGLYPVELERGGLRPALEDLANRTEALTQTQFEVIYDDGFHVDPGAALHLYRIVQEAVNNAIKHGKATRVEIHCTSEKGASSVRVLNDGLTFTQPAGATGIGLDMMKYRASVINATIQFAPRETGGCEMVCRLNGARHRQAAPANILPILVQYSGPAAAGAGALQACV